jgi:uncharacterized membrane protein YukC
MRYKVKQVAVGSLQRKHMWGFLIKIAAALALVVSMSCAGKSSDQAYMLTAHIILLLIILSPLVLFFILVARSKRPKLTQVTVNSVQSMESAITSYIAEGFSLVNKTDKTAIMQKKKQFSTLWAVLGLALCVIPLIIYILIYAVQTDVQVVEIVVS